MKNHFNFLCLLVSFCTLMILPAKMTSQVSCPFIVTNSLSCQVCFNYEIRRCGSCATPCSGTACVNGSGGTWTAPCCYSGICDILITIGTIGGVTVTAQVGNNGGCGNGSTPVTGVLPAAVQYCQPNSSGNWSATWNPSGVLIQ